MNKILVAIGAFGCICFALLMPAAYAASTATLTGQVTDQQGSVIADAIVVATNVDTNASSTAHTTATGLYTIPNLPPGRYRVTVRKDGFRTIIKPDVVLNVQDFAALNFSLSLGSVLQSVTVEGGTPLLNTESATVGTVVDRNFVEDLPLNGRSFNTLLQVTPGVVLTPTQESGEQGQFAINGNRADANYFSIDGVSANFAISPSAEFGQDAAGALPALSALGGTNNLVSVDALQEFKVETSNFAPEFGRGGAQIVLVTRSGTNQFHGSAFDYVRNDVFDAADWFADHEALPKAPVRQNDFGGVFGGPVVKNNTFFFFSYEGLRLRQPRVAITDVPSVLARQSAVPAARPFLNAFPLPNGPATITEAGRVLANQFAGSYSDPSTLNAYSLRMDHSISSRATLFGRVDYSPSQSDVRAIAGRAPLSNVGSTRLTAFTATSGLTLALSPTLNNEFRFNYSQDTGSQVFHQDTFGGAIPPPDSVWFPPGWGSSVNSEGLIIIFGLRNGEPFSGVKAKNDRQHQINFVDNLAMTKGNHSFKFGFDFRRLAPVTGTFKDSPGMFFFDISSLLNGSIDLAFLENNQTAVHLIFHQYGVFAQDAWRVSPRLTLTYGLRWDYNPPPSESTGNPPLAVDQVSNLQTMTLQPRGTKLWDASHKNFAPRLGASYLLRQGADWSTIVRGGFGIFYALGTESVGNAARFFQFPYAATATPSGIPLPLTLPPPALILAPPFGVMSIFDPHLKTPYIEQWNAAIEQGLGASQKFSITYSGSVGKRLLRQDTLNSIALPVNPMFTYLYLTTNSGSSNYNGLQLQYQRRLAHGLQALMSYTWSHSLDVVSNDTSTGVNFDTSTFFPSQFYNVQQDYGASDFDIRHIVSGALTYELPENRGSGPLHYLTEGWSVNPVIQIRSGPPFNVIYTPDTATMPFLSNTGPLNARPDVVPGVPAWIDDPSAAGRKALNPAAFVVPMFATAANFRQGTEARNSLRGFGAWQADLALHREFPLRERLHLLFGLEVFNIFNHPNFGSIGNNIRSSSSILAVPAGFGVSSATLANSLGGGLNGGFNPLYQMGGARSMQLSLKVQF